MDNVAEAMAGVPSEICIRAIARFYQANEKCGLGIAQRMNIDEPLVLAEAQRQKTQDR